MSTPHTIGDPMVFPPLLGQPTHTVVYADGGIDAQSPHPQCPKCRALMSDLAYQGGPDEFDGPWSWRRDHPYDCPRGEHMHRKCPTCRYGRWEPCADAEEHA